ncbi:ABC transporter permease [bacterium]|nr:ABC transporter permease [bacterium]
MPVLERIDAIGESVLGLVEFFRDIAVLAFGAMKSIALTRRRGARVVYEILLAQIRFTGAQGAALSAFAALALGTLIQIELVSFIPNAEAVPSIVALIVVKDMAPLLTAIIMIGRSGTAISVELANMKLNGEIDALVSMGLSLEHVVVLPRLLGAMISFMGMIVFAQASALVGGYWLGTKVTHMPFTLAVLIRDVELGDVFIAFLKAALMGAAIAVICIREGFSVSVSQREVPQAATRGVVRSMVFCLVLNTFISIFT